MGITCRIVRDSDGIIDYIESNDGQRSVLFDNLRSLYGTEKALEYYALTESDNFKDVQEVKKEAFTFSGQETLNKLEETGLADNVYQMTSEEIEAKLIELGVDTDVAKQVVAYHGSPYSFDRFTTEKMGTGEGAQAFGWGLYFTDLKSIAENYAVKLADVNPIEYIKINGRSLDISHKYFKEIEQGISNYEQLLGKQPNTVSDIVSFMDESDLKNRLEKGELTLDFKINNLPNRNLYKVSLHKGKTPDQYTWLEWDKPVKESFTTVDYEVSDFILSKYEKEIEVVEKYTSGYSAYLISDNITLNSYNTILEQLIDSKNTPFSLIEEDFGVTKTNLEDFLKILDKDLSTLDKKVVRSKGVNDSKLNKIINSLPSNSKNSINISNGELFYKSLSKELGSQKEASLFLLENGIDGIKYPAESISRGATSATARGFNYVVFDENAITIEEQIQFQKAGIDKITNGFVVGKDVYLNKDTATENTQIHEFNHLYQKQLKSERPKVYKKGLDLIKAELTKNDSKIKGVIDFVKNNQPDLKGEKFLEEVLTELVGRRGLELLIKEKNKAKSSGIIDWLSEVWKEIKSMLGISSMSDEEVLKLNLEDFTKASAVDLLSGSKLSKKETVKVEKNEVNGKLVYEPFFKGKKMGALRLLPYNGGYRVDSVIVYDKFQKKGVAKNLYKYAINDLSKQGISLSFLNIRAPYAEKIWEGLVNEGIATKDGNDYRAFREPKVSEVLEYANETEEPLTKEQSVQAIDTLASFGINNSLELFEKLKEAFVKDGVIVFDRKKLEKAGYNSYEITSILTNRDLQQQIKENIHKVKNTDLSIDLEGLEVLKTDEINIFGKQTVYVKSEREAINEIVDGEIRSKKTDTLQTLNKTYPKTLPEIDTRPFETILKVTENVAKNNPEKLKKVAQAMQEEASKYGVDLRGIENKIYPIQMLKSFTESLVNYISEPNNNFSEVYDKFFEVNQLPKVENEGNDIKLDTELSEYELFRDYNLVRKEGNIYTKISPENIEDLYNYFLRQQESKVQELSKIDELYDKASKVNDFETFVDSVADFRDAHSAPSKDTTPTEEKLNTGGDFSLEEVARGFHNQPDDYFEPKNGARYYNYNTIEGMQSFTAINNVIRSIKAGNDNIKITSYRAIPNGVDINELKDYDWVSFSENYAKNHGESRFGEGEYKIIQQEVDIKDLWWDGNDINEWGYDTGNTKKYSRRELKSIFDNSRKLTKEDIQSRIPELEVEDYQTDSDVLEALFIWKNFLGYPIKTKSNKKAPFKGMTNNPFKVVTADGIVLKNNDTLTRAKADLYEEEVVKQDIDYQDEVREKISLGEIIPEKIKTDYTIIEDGVLMTKNNTNQFLRTPLANYELIYQDGNLSFYKEVLGAEKNLSDIDFTKYLNESVKPDNYIVAKNSYSKQELEEINNKYFSCK